jgi:hypothetical protein
MNGLKQTIVIFYSINCDIKKNISETGRSNKKAQATLGTKHRTQTNKTKTQHGTHQTKTNVNEVFEKGKP